MNITFKMNLIKTYLINYIWSGDDIQIFEKWLYSQNRDDIEAFFGTIGYMEIINYDFRRGTIDSLKNKIKVNLPSEKFIEFETIFKSKEKYHTGKCIKKEGLDYQGTKMRNWDLQIGKTYAVINISESLHGAGNHSYYIQFADFDNDLMPSGYIPMAFFEMDTNLNSAHYKTYKNSANEKIIEPIEWSKGIYKPTQHSFWEDFYDDETKALKTYYNTLGQLGIKNVW